MHGAFNFQFAPDQWIDFAVNCKLIEIRGVFLERRCFGFSISINRGLVFLVASITWQLRHAVRYVINHVETGHVLQIQKIDCLRLLLAEDGDENVRAGHLRLATRLHVEHGALEYALKSQCRLHIALIVMGQKWRLLIYEFVKLSPEFRDIRITGFQDLMHFRHIEQCK